MSIRDVSVTTLVSLLLTALVFFVTQIGTAQIMQSGSYRIQSDSVNFGGGLSTSTNYSLESTGGEVGTGESSSTNYSLKAGYQQMTSSFISLSTPGDVTMTPTIVGITGGIANGSTTVTVITDSAAGYELTIQSDESPALKKGSDSIANYSPSVDPDFTFTFGVSEARFGYSPSGVDTASRFLDNGSACNIGALETTLACWDGLSTTSVVIAEGGGANHPLGATTTVYFRVGVGSSVVQAPGTYTATTTLTALPL